MTAQLQVFAETRATVDTRTNRLRLMDIESQTVLPGLPLANFDVRRESSKETWPDAWLINGVRREPPDDSALDVLVARYWKPLFARCQMLTLDRDAASDLAQESWLRVLRARGSLEPDGNFRAYIMTIATNLWRDRNRHERRAGAMSDSRIESLDATDPNDDQPLALMDVGDERLAQAHLDVSTEQAYQPVFTERPTKLQISITEIPRYDPVGGPDTRADIAGKIAGEVDKEYRVVIYARADAWYIQPVPYALHPILPDSTWKSWTHTGSDYAALVVRNEYKPVTRLDVLPSVQGDVFARTIVEGKRQ